MKGVSDGSFKDGFDTASWKLEANASWVKADVTVRGEDRDDQDAYRSSLQSLSRVQKGRHREHANITDVLYSRKTLERRQATPPNHPRAC